MSKVVIKFLGVVVADGSIAIRILIYYGKLSWFDEVWWKSIKLMDFIWNGLKTVWQRLLCAKNDHWTLYATSDSNCY